jgi:hypothetical protein
MMKEGDGMGLHEWLNRGLSFRGWECGASVLGKEGEVILTRLGKIENRGRE